MCDSPELLKRLDRLIELYEDNGGDTRRPVEQSFHDSYYFVSNTQSKWYLDWKGRKHLYIWSQNALTLQLNDLGVQPIAAQTWTELAGRPGQQIFTTNQTSPVEVLVRATNELIVDFDTRAGTQGWIAPTGTGTASQDDPLTFATQIRYLVLYNASANAIPLEFDQVSTATSFPLQPGASLILDNIQITVVHVFPSATLPINTTSGLYIKGWT